MTPIHWLEFGAALHLLLADGQRRMQALIAALVPALGAIVVYVMAREADAPLPAPKPSTQRFDRADG